MPDEIDGGAVIDAENRRLAASEFWLDAQRAVMLDREAKGLPIFGLAASERERIEIEVALVAGIRVANLALNHFKDSSSIAVQTGETNG